MTWDRRTWVRAVAAARDPQRKRSSGALPGGSRRYTPAYRHVLAELSTYADHATGENARPSMRALAAATGYEREKVAEVMAQAVEDGWVIATGARTPAHGGRPVTVWAMTYPPGASPDDGRTQSDHCNGRTQSDHRDDANGRTQSGHRSGRSMAGPGPNQWPDQDRVNGRTGSDMTSSTSRPPEGGRDEEEGAPRPSAGAAGRRAPAHAAAGDAVAAIATTVIGRGRAWGEYDARRIDAAQLAAVVAPWLHAGWTADDLAAAAATSSRPRSNPAQMLATHLQRTLGDTDPHTWRQRQAAVAVEPAATTGRGRRGATKKAKAATGTTTPRKAATGRDRAAEPPLPPQWLHHVANDMGRTLGGPLSRHYEQTTGPDGRSTGRYVLRHDGTDVLVLRGDVGSYTWTATRPGTDQAVDITAGQPSEATTRRLLELWRTPTTDLTNGATA